MSCDTSACSDGADYELASTGVASTIGVAGYAKGPSGSRAGCGANDALMRLTCSWINRKGWLTMLAPRFVATWLTNGALGALDRGCHRNSALCGRLLRLL